MGSSKLTNEPRTAPPWTTATAARSTKSATTVRLRPATSITAWPTSDELDAPRREDDHPQEQEAVAEALDVRLAVDPLPVAGRHVHDAEVLLRRPEDEVEVAERIEVAEVGPVRRDALVVSPPEHLRPAEGVLERLPEEPREGEAEELVRDEVQEPHR